MSWGGLFEMDRKLDRILQKQESILTQLTALKAQGDKIMLDISIVQANLDKLAADVTAIVAEIKNLNDQLAGTSGDQAAVDTIAAKLAEQVTNLESVMPVPTP